jgi:hypothetical protein
MGDVLTTVTCNEHGIGQLATLPEVSELASTLPELFGPVFQALEPKETVKS